MDAYRDPLAALRSQIATKRAVVEDTERRLQTVLALLAEAERGVIDAARTAATGEADTVEALCEIERQLDGMQASFAELASAWALPEEPALPEPAPEPWDREGQGTKELRALLEASFDGGTAEPFGPEAFLMRFLDEGVVFALVADLFPTEKEGAAGIGHLALTLRASMPEPMPAFAMGPEMDIARYQARIGQARTRRGLVHFGKKAKPLPPELAFWKTGNEAAARLLVGEAVHERLLDLLATCVLEAPASRVYPTLGAGPGFVEVGYTRPWEGEDTELVPEDALTILHEIRGRVKV